MQHSVCVGPLNTKQLWPPSPHRPESAVLFRSKIRHPEGKGTRAINDGFQGRDNNPPGVFEAWNAEETSKKADG